MSRLAAERASLGTEGRGEELAQLQLEESQSRTHSEAAGAALAAVQGRVPALRAAQLAAEDSLESARGAREAARVELTSLEALQAAALSAHAGEAS